MLNPLCVAVYPPPPSADPPPTKNKSIPDDAVPKLENVSVPLVKNLILQLSPPSLINSLSPVYVYDTPPVVHDDAWFLIITIPEPPAEPPPPPPPVLAAPAICPAPPPPEPPAALLPLVLFWAPPPPPPAYNVPVDEPNSLVVLPCPVPLLEPPSEAPAVAFVYSSLTDKQALLFAVHGITVHCLWYALAPPPEPPFPPASYVPPLPPLTLASVMLDI